MTVYPEIESWDEFYPSEIFVLLGENESPLDAERLFKKANIGTTIYLGTDPANTAILKKIGESNGIFLDKASNLILVGIISGG